MYYVYILKSLRNNDLYVGSTENLENRLFIHNKGRIKLTKAYRPWKLMDYTAYTSRSEAVGQERFLKTGQQKGLLKKKFGRVAK